MAEFLDTKGIESAIKYFEKCLNKKGLKIKIDPKKKEEPGLANLLYTLIEFFDKLYATVLSPYAKLIDLAKRIKAALTDPTQLAKLIQKVNELIKEIQEAVSNVIKFVIEKLTEPLKKYAIPLSFPIGPVTITLSGGVDKIKDPKQKKATEKYLKGAKDAQAKAQKIVTRSTDAVTAAKKKADEAKAKVEAKIKAAQNTVEDAKAYAAAQIAAVQKIIQDQMAAAFAQLEEAKKYLTKIITSLLGVPEWIQKQITLLMTFIQTAIDFVLSAFKAAIDALKSPVKKLIELFLKLTKNPIQFFLDLLKKAIQPILIALAPKFTKIKEKASKLKADVEKFLDLVFSLKSFDITKFTSKVFKAVAPFFALVGCTLSFAITFLPTVVKSLLSF
jgi:DNA repair exonuclease SbcCD ATPase subunit